MYALKFAVNQMLPCLSITRPCGPDIGLLVRYSLMLPVFGSMCPSRLAMCPVYQIVPSGAASGSWGRVPGVGKFHSLKDTSTLPGMAAGAGPGFAGKFLIK